MVFSDTVAKLAVLKGETVRSWTQMITVTGAKGLAEGLAGSLGRLDRRRLQDRLSRQLHRARLWSGQIRRPGCLCRGGHCARLESSADKHSETALIVAVKGIADYYTLQWAERAPTSAKAPIDEAKWLARLRLLQPIRVCPIVPGERAPYPSCASQK